jgi:hypothetical protein
VVFKELEIIWNEEAVVKFRAMFRHLLGGTEVINEKPESR